MFKLLRRRKTSSSVDDVSANPMRKPRSTDTSKSARRKSLDPEIIRGELSPSLVVLDQTGCSRNGVSVSGDGEERGKPRSTDTSKSARKKALDPEIIRGKLSTLSPSLVVLDQTGSSRNGVSVSGDGEDRGHGTTVPPDDAVLAHSDASLLAPEDSADSGQQNPRAREPQRRRTTVVTYNPQSSRLLDYEDPGTMSDVELSSFQRGGVARASLPIVRSASSSLERPMGLVFLVYGSETKKALLPNEITTLDTVRALFVRAFPEKLSMHILDSPKRKIYILEAATSIFFQLEDLRDIQDRTVLKIHECDSDEPQRVKSLPESRGRAVQPAVSRPPSSQGYASDTGSHYREEMGQVQSLPASAGHNYQDLMQRERAQWEMEQEYMQAQQRRSRSRSQTPELAERPRSLSTGAPRNRYSHSPDRLPTPERGAPPHLNPIPENPRLLANGFRQAAMNGSHYEALPGSRNQQPHPAAHSQPPGRVLSPPPAGQPIYESVYQPGGYPHPHPHPQSYMSHSMRTAPPHGPQRATGPPPPDMRGGNRGGPSNRHSLAFAAMSNPIYETFPQKTQSYRATPEREVLPHRPQGAAPQDPNRMERMEAQIASLAAWVHQVHASPSEPVRRGPGSSRSTSSGHSDGTDTYPGSSASKQNGETSFTTSPGLSDIPAAYTLRQPAVTTDMREKMNDMQCRLRELRVELQGLKRMEQLNQDSMRDAFADALCKVKMVLGAVPGAGNPVQLQNVVITAPVESYMQNKRAMEKELSDLERRVDELKEGVIARKRQIIVTDIESMALVLSNITKSIADLKAQFPQVHESLKTTVSGQGDAMSEDRFFRDESLSIEATLKRCKNLTSTLYTLKRLATVQDVRSPHVPSSSVDPTDLSDETMAILENIQSLVPSLDTALQNTQTADTSREHKQRAATHQDCSRLTNTGQGVAVTSSQVDTRLPTVNGTGVDAHRCQAPEVPAKPARLLSASEVKQLESAISTVSAGAHTVTVTSQVSDDRDKKTVEAGGSSARSSFFNSMQSPPVSPTSLSETKTSSKLPTTPRSGVASSGPNSLSLPAASSVSSLTSPSHSKPVSGVYYQAASPTRTRATSSSIPLPNKPTDKEESARSSEKGKKVPPPPPPRRSSAKLPYGPGALSPNTNGGQGNSASSREGGGSGGGSKSLDVQRRDSTGKSLSPTSPGASGPKPGSGTKQPMNKFQKDIAAGIYSNLNRPDLQNQRMAPDRLLNTMASPPPAAVTTNSQDPQDEGELSGSESTGSSTSLDSQQGAALLRSNSIAAANRGPKPNPPQRHSSLGIKAPGPEEGTPKTKTLQERVKKSQEAGKARKVSGSAFSQVNGLDGARNGHKT